MVATTLFIDVRKMGTLDRVRRELGDDDVASADAWRFEPIFVDLETLDFRIKSSRRQPQFRGCAGGARDPSVTFRQCGFNHLLLLPRQDMIQPTRPATGNREKPANPGLVHRKGVSLAQNDGAFNYVL